MAQTLDGVRAAEDAAVAAEAALMPTGPRPAFFAKTATPLEWKLLAAAIKTQAEQVTFRATPAGLTFSSKSEGSFTMVSVDWPAGAFHRYECAEGGVAMTVRVDQFVKALARADAGDSVEVSKTANGLLKLSFRGDKSKDFQLHLLADQEAGRRVKIDFVSFVTFAPGVMESALGDMDVVGEKFSLSVAPGLVRFSGGSQDTGTARLELPEGDPGLLKLEPGTGAEAAFKIDQIQPVLSAFRGSKSPVRVSLADAKPIRLDFPLNEAGAAVTFHAAPVQAAEGGKS